MILDRAHRGDEAPPRRPGERPDHLFDGKLRLPVEIAENLAALGGERNVRTACVVRRTLARDQPAAREISQYPAEITRIETQSFLERARARTATRA